MSSESMQLAIDRSGWPPGPWDNEPDRLHWIDEATHLDCLIVRNRLGGLCGYVGVPIGHPWYEKDYDNIDAECHGGLTYSNYCSGGICHTADEAENKLVWWIGFDCVHCFDICPSERGRRERHGTYRTINYVRRQCAELAAQVEHARS